VNVHINSLVPLGKGLGGSAALCVFVTRVLRACDFLSEDKEFSFSVELENMFHGESSGVDIAGCLSSGPNAYVRGEALKPLEKNLKGFIFGLTETGEVGDTEDCITKVLALKSRDKDLFYSLDSDMNEASKNVALAIEENNGDLLLKSFSEAVQVFESWGLVTDKMKETMCKLSQKGALVSKPTGSGLGGYMISIWKEENKDIAKSFCSELFEL
jgi:mevalonate kinase